MKLDVLRAPPMLATSEKVVFPVFGMQDSLQVFRDGVLFTSSGEQSIRYGGVYVLDEIVSLQLLPARVFGFSDTVIFLSNSVSSGDAVTPTNYNGDFPTVTDTVPIGLGSSGIASETLTFTLT